MAGIEPSSADFERYTDGEFVSDCAPMQAPRIKVPSVVESGQDALREAVRGSNLDL